jgi:hypothetical protein
MVYGTDPAARAAAPTSSPRGEHATTPKGDIGNVSVLAPEAQSVNWVVTYVHDAEGWWLIAFAANPQRLPMDTAAR